MGEFDRYYIKRFEDETELRTYLLVDASASMGYGRGGVTKLDYARYLAAALAYLLAQQGIRRGCCCSTRRRASICRPAPGADISGIC